ncbi:hypothetical protein F52700_7447 [Fusarium sp. NRRL 52700]|nr:hypothetical protein F52700_7447 [Fusarium sp. NRRL 52700]
MACLAYMPKDVLVEIFSYFCLHCRGDLKPIKGVGTPHQQKRCREPQQPDQKSWYSIDKYTLFSLAASWIAHEFSWPDFSVDTIEKVRDYRHSLEILHLDLRDVYEWSPSYRPDSTFQDFEKLRHVLLSVQLIFDISRNLKVEDRYAITRLLPPSIVSLHLVWDGAKSNRHFHPYRQKSLPVNRFEQGLLGLAAAATGDFPNLKFVGLDFAEVVDATVEAAIRGAGIEFAYESWPVSYKKEIDDA